MKRILLSALACSAFSTSAFAESHKFVGSDTLLGIVNDAIISGGLESEIQYLGGGSSAAEKAVVAGASQGLLPMSREVKPEASQALTAKGITLVPHVIALDGVAVFTHSSNSTPALDIETIRKIFACEITNWENVPGSGKTGAIDVVRRDDRSGTTDAFKQFTKVTFGACAKPLAETNDIANYTGSKTESIGFSGLTARRETNKMIPISKRPGEPGILPTVRNVRSFAYPFSRKLYVYEAKGQLRPSEQRLLAKMTDRSFMDPIVQDNEFYTID